MLEYFLMAGFQDCTPLCEIATMLY